MPDLLILVNGVPGAGKTTLARQLGEALGAVVISKDTIKEAMADAVELDDQAAGALGSAAMEAAWVLAGRVRGPAIVESWWFAPRDREFVRAGISTVSPVRLVEIWCDAGAATARARYTARRRHDVHRDAERLEQDWETWATEGRPLALSPVVRVDTSRPVDVAALAAAVSDAADTPWSGRVSTTGADYATIAQGYARAFPDGDEPLRILARLTEELGEVAAEVAHLERHGAKVAKHGEPDRQHLADEVEDLVHNAFALLRHYDAEAGFDQAVTATIGRLRRDGWLE